ncbi:hypothetical protein NL64_27410 [Pseudomonas fluorescens]|uniref:hypothetical protein n=1 Tax=Pseudomonas fluorescens TaxID=294 RepID=UPI00054C44F9|nr:hypothetical protein [Pseudomonas fluorescens]KII27538.1 hypothetical protein NL64_27410 [Pseudomonas fluorescens]
MIEIIFNIFGVISLWLAIEYSLKHQSVEHIDEASLMPFADDPEVAQRVEMATGLTVKSTATETMEWVSGSLFV